MIRLQLDEAKENILYLMRTAASFLIVALMNIYLLKQFFYL